MAEIELTMGHMGYEIVRVQVLGRERPTVQVMADRADGSLISIEDCERINDVVSATLDVADIDQVGLDAGDQQRRHRPATDPA